MENRQIMFEFAAHKRDFDDTKSLNNSKSVATLKIVGRSSTENETKSEYKTVWDELCGIEEVKSLIDSYVHWKILMPISVFTFLRTFRPGTSYFVYYLTKVKGVTDDYMNNRLLLVMTSSYLLMMFVLGGCNYRFGYKYIIPFELGCQILARVMFLWGTNESFSYVYCWLCCIWYCDGWRMHVVCI